jgi:hypothetical protein
LNGQICEPPQSKVSCRAAGLRKRAFSCVSSVVTVIIFQKCQSIVLLLGDFVSQIPKKMKGDDYGPIIFAENQNQHSNSAIKKRFKEFLDIDFTKATFCASIWIPSNVITNYNLCQTFHSSQHQRFVELRQCIGQLGVQESIRIHPAF